MAGLAVSHGPGPNLLDLQFVCPLLVIDSGFAMQVHSSLSPEERDELQIRMIDYQKTNREQQSELAALAAESGKLECLKVLRNWLYVIDGKTWEAAATAGHLDVLEWLHEISPGSCGIAASYAAGAGHLDCFAYLHGINAPWNEFTAVGMALKGHLPCLAFMIEHGCNLSPVICSSAADGGHIDCLRYLHAQGCPWDAYTANKAAMHGHLECLMFAVEHGCPVDDDALGTAVEFGEEECLEYLLRCGFRPEKPLKIQCLEDESLWDCIDLLELYGVDIHAGQTVYAASLWDLAVVRHFHAAGLSLWHAAVNEFSSALLVDDGRWLSWSWFLRLNTLSLRAIPHPPSSGRVCCTSPPLTISCPHAGPRCALELCTGPP